MNSYNSSNYSDGNTRRGQVQAQNWQGRTPSISYEQEEMAPKLAATFYPGGADDFMMPELVSPSPQRIMPEVPLNMQEGIARLELEGDNMPVLNRRTSSISSTSSDTGQRGVQQSVAPPQKPPEPYRGDNTPKYQRRDSSADHNAYAPQQKAPEPYRESTPKYQQKDSSADRNVYQNAPPQKTPEQYRENTPKYQRRDSSADRSIYENPLPQKAPEPYRENTPKYQRTDSLTDRNVYQNAPPQKAPEQFRENTPKYQRRDSSADRNIYENAQPQKAPEPYRDNPPKYQQRNSSAERNVYEDAPRPLEIRKNYTNSRDDQFPSAFPKIRNLGPSIPPSDDDKEDMLENERPMVLKSNDPELQLTWAQNALIWVDGAIQSRIRDSGDANSRPITPRIEHQLRVDAMSIINYLADQTHPRAVFLRSTWYEFGKFGYALDRKEAFQGYRTAAEKGYARAEYRIGTQYESMHDMAKAIKHYSIGMSMGDSASNYRLGMMNLLGQHGQAQDYELGIRRISLSADTADENAPQGAYIYGMLLGRELPNINIPENVLPVDFEQAKLYIEKAAYLGFAKAQAKMGQAYELCFLNCDFNPSLSLHYSALAARQGEPEAELAVSKWFICGYEGEFEKNDELAFTYAQRAARTGLATAEIAMGYFYEIGMHVPTDLVQAQVWYQKAADHGHKEAYARLEGLKQHKALSRKDHEEIAITRIRSQYGAKRGGRPDRPERTKDRYTPLPAVTESPAPPQGRYTPLQAVTEPQAPPQGRYTPLPAVTETPASPQDPTYHRDYPNSGPGPTVVLTEGNLQPRSQSTAPYPEDDLRSGPGNLQTRPQQRLRDGPIADRPMSAFGIRSPPSQQNTLGDGYLAAGPARPSTGQGYHFVPEGRGSNPAGRSRVMSAGWEPQKPPLYGREISPGRASTPQAPLPPYGRQISPGRASTPLAGPPIYGREDSAGRSSTPQAIPPNQLPYGANQDGRNRLQKFPPNGGKPQPPLPGQQAPYPQTPHLAHARTGSLPERPSYERNNTLPGRLSPYPDERQPALPPGGSMWRPERVDSMPQSFSRNPQRPLSAQGLSASQPPRSSSVSPSTIPPAAPPKKGAQSFEEMGIPHTKHESECVVM